MTNKLARHTDACIEVNDKSAKEICVCATSVAEHTPGPYGISGGNILAGTEIIAVMPKVVETSKIKLVERDANQRLLAAAPELLEALKLVTRALEQHLVDDAKRNGVAVEELCPCSTNEVSAAKAAIAKAEDSATPRKGD